MKKNNKISKIILITLTILTAAFLSYVIYHKKNNKAFRVFGNYISVVVSGSMEPTIMTHDFIVYKASESYQIDDVIVFAASGMLIVHRIIEVRENGFITKGDNNINDDFNTFGIIKPNQILGKVSNNFKLLGLGKLIIE